MYFYFLYFPCQTLSRLCKQNFVLFRTCFIQFKWKLNVLHSEYIQKQIQKGILFILIFLFGILETFVMFESVWVNVSIYAVLVDGAKVLIFVIRSHWIILSLCLVQATFASRMLQYTKICIWVIKYLILHIMHLL